MPVQCRQHTVHPGDAVVVQQHPHPNASIGGLVHGFQQQGSRSVAVPDIILDIETADGGARQQNRSEARRVGKECVSTCRSRWSPYNEKKKINYICTRINEKYISEKNIENN